MSQCERCGIPTTLSRQCGLCIAEQHDHDRLMDEAIEMLENNIEGSHQQRQPGCKTCLQIRAEAA